MSQITVRQLFEETREKLQLVWHAGEAGGGKLLTSETIQKPTLALIGHLNFVHPNRVQVLGCAEMDYLKQLAGEHLNEAIENLFSTELAAIIVSNGEPVPEPLMITANATQTPLFTSPGASPQLMDVLGHYLAKVLAPSTNLHGVFMEVFGLGVLLTGDSSIGKSELALELITRNHRLIADDMVTFYQIAPEVIEGSCPGLLQDFLEVRGLGVLNVRALFGETSIKMKQALNLIIHLEKLTPAAAEACDRLQMNECIEPVLGVKIPKVQLPVAAGRNLAVLVEVAARNHILHLRGINSTQQFIERHDAALVGQ